MNLLIKSARIIDINSKHHNKVMDILIKNGKIEQIAKSIKNKNQKEMTHKNLYVSPGWFDLHVNFGEPGFEQKETFYSGCKSAAEGGFTSVLTMPNTNPKIDNKPMVELIKNMTQKNIIDVYPAGNLTEKGKGNNIVEMHDMHNAGCIAFTDDKDSISKSQLLKIAMLYSNDCDTLIMNHPNEKDLSNKGQIHEGNISAKFGIKGIPRIAEEIMVNRDITLCEYTKSRFHLSYISTKESVKQLKKAKSKGLNITADVSLYNLFLTDKKIIDFDTRYKVIPPLREESDNKALIRGLKDGTIDAITTDHTPQDEENKKVEFNNAKNGIIGLESAFGLLIKNLSPHINISQIIEKIAINPRKILKLPKVVINEGEYANLTLFDPELEWIFTEKNIKSKSKNTPFIGEKLKGKALGIYNNKKFFKCKS